MTLAEFHIELARTNELLDRIATALERIAGPPVEPRPPRRAELSDLMDASPEKVEELIQDHLRFATENQMVPGSDLAIRAWLEERR